MKSTATLANNLRLSADTEAIDSEAYQGGSDTFETLTNDRATEREFPITMLESLGKLLPAQGLILFDEIGELLQSNDRARQFCSLIWDAPAEQTAPTLLVPHRLPEKISKLCGFLVDSLLEFPNQACELQLWEDIFLDNGLRFRLNAEWIMLDELCILIRIEDMTQSAGRRALGDACLYHLTPRETEVWALFLQGFKYQDISDKLFIGIDTVKKHMKNVHSKRRGELF